MIILFAPTHVRAVSPSLVPVEGDAVLWVVGQNLRFDEAVGAAVEARCVFSAGGGGGHVSQVDEGGGGSGALSHGNRNYDSGEAGFALAVSSAVAVCVTPPGGRGASRGDRASGGGSELSFPGPGAAHLSAGALSDHGGSSSTVLVRWQHFGLPRVARVEPGMSRESGGTSVDIAVHGAGGSAGSSSASACLFGTLGPVAGRDSGGGGSGSGGGGGGGGVGGDHKDSVSVQCITPAAAAGVRPLALATGLTMPQRGPYSLSLSGAIDGSRGLRYPHMSDAAAESEGVQLWHSTSAVVEAAMPSLVPADAGNPAAGAFTRSLLSST